MDHMSKDSLTTRKCSNPQRRRWAGWACLMFWLLGMSGCASTLDNLNVNETFGSIGRRAKNKADEIKREESDAPPVGQEEFDAAMKLYEDKKYKEARKAFHVIAKNKKWKEEPVVEDAMFYRAESDFQMGKFASAQDGYDELLKAHPATKHLELSVRRMYKIGLYWLESPKPASEVELASFTQENGAEVLASNPESRIPFQWTRLQPNFTDKTRPLFDTPGRAVQALKTVTLHDTQGPLAPKATMTLAVYFLRRRDYQAADSYFNELRTHYSKSDYCEAAYVLGAHASLMSYLGSDYDGKQLEEARKLTQSALRLYPNSPQRAKLERDLKNIDVEFIQRDWRRAEFYLKRREYKSAAIYCEDLINKHPESEQAAKAREVLLKLGPDYSAGILKTPLLPTPVAPPATEEGGAGEEPGRLREADEGASSAPDDE
jgi:outer membrane protein assembly factor BamD (BamD/ComL family)